MDQYNDSLEVFETESSALTPELEEYTPFQAGPAEEEEWEEPESEEEDYRAIPQWEEETPAGNVQQLYAAIGLAGKGLPFDAFHTGLNGYHALRKKGVLKNADLITIIDFNQPSSQKRMYIIDLKQQKLLLQCKVAHGKNSSCSSNPAIPRCFSNKIGSNQSSLGFYITLGTYQGKHGLSLQLEGMEPDFNSNAKRRRVVIHGADYVKENTTGRAGTSWGCPAIDNRLVHPVIQLIKGGTCLFLFSRDPDYLKKSTLAGAALSSGIATETGSAASSGTTFWQTVTAPFRATESTGAAPSASPSKNIAPTTVANIRQYDEGIERLSKKAGLDPNIVRGIIAAESRGHANAGSGSTGYKGLMQADRTPDQLNPEISIATGIKKYQDFKTSLEKGLKLVHVPFPPLKEDAYAQMILTCYNAGHVTVIKALQYARQAGDITGWLKPEYYQRALLFTGAYDLYTKCTRGAAAADIATAKKQKASYRFKKSMPWYRQLDPPAWNTVSGQLSPVLRCWIETKRSQTPGYLNVFLQYFNYFSGAGIQKENEWEENEASDHESFLTGFASEENEIQLYGPEYFDATEREEAEGFENDFYEQSEEETEETETEEEEWENLEETEEENLEELTTAAFESGPEAIHKGTAPRLMGRDKSVPGDTCYVNINLGKANYPLTKTGIYVPAHFTTLEPVILILYLHGMTGAFPGAAAQIDQYWTLSRPGYDFRLREEVNASGKNCLLVAPSLGNSPNAYKNALSGAPGGLDHYLQQVLSAVNTYLVPGSGGRTIHFNNIIIAAHSAGGSQMRKIVTMDNPVYGHLITECWGFDSLYGGERIWLRWAEQHAAKKLMLYYLSSTQAHCTILQNMARKKGVNNIFMKRSTALNHYLVPKEHIKHRLMNIQQKDAARTVVPL